MKKNYFLAVLFTFAMVSVNAQFTDDMESYTDGQPISGGHWTDWGCGGGAGCAIMSSSAQAHGGSLSGYVPDDTTTDAVLDLGNKIFGTWGLSFWAYVPSGKEGYYNLQGTVPIGPGEWIVGNIYFNKDNANPGVGEIDDSALGVVNFNFPHDEWFYVAMNVDISAGIGASTWEFGVNGNVAIPAGTAFTDNAGTYPTSLGGLDLFSINANHQMWYDDFTYQDSFVSMDPPLGVNDLAAKGFAAYPNPVSNILNLKANEAITSVAIFNILGQEVYNAKVNAVSSTVDMSSYASGAYFVKVNIGGTEGIVKVVK
ncbi:MAG: T9SS type A sorting domain-containing protein [Altibacter sp.]|uniref:T9SS type A sorting domain-containing protein n=1 Tax=Altibacter sp. TaxID=2024823 RepID=UPI001D6ED16E|nr:T9SS type A sorting domain-containing protein [Altibacter sp.]MBZ0326075.1 T9SS type A sorting domain-containing protein [Altibacter sp.]